MNNRLSEEQINALRKYYPKGDWDSILPFFPNTTKANIRATARRYGLHVDDKNRIIDENIAHGIDTGCSAGTDHRRFRKSCISCCKAAR